MTPLDRSDAFCRAYGIAVPILMAPMAGASPPALAASVANAGGMGACGCLTMSPDEIGEWARQVRMASNGAFQLNTWIPGPAQPRDSAAEADVRAFLADWGPEVPEDRADMPAPDFNEHVAAMLSAGPTAMSSIMGVFPPEFVTEMKTRGIRWFATVTSLAEAKEAAAAGADVIVAQGAEAGGHRGTFTQRRDAALDVGLFALIPAVADATGLPIVATGGIGDARGVAAALMLGASAVQIGTGLLRSPEAAIHPAWADAIGRTQSSDTIVTRAYSGRRARMLRNAYTEASRDIDPRPFPVQAGLTAPLKADAMATGDLSRMQAFCGQAGGLAKAQAAGDIVRDMWDDAHVLLKG